MFTIIQHGSNYIVGIMVVWGGFQPKYITQKISLTFPFQHFDNIGEKVMKF